MPECQCPPLYEGPHCEFLTASTADEQSPSVDNINGSNADTSDSDDVRGGLIAFLVLFFGLGSLILIFWMQRLKEKRRNKREVVINIQDFRDENYGAKSVNGNMLFPSMRPPMSHGLDYHERMHDVDIS
jgi:hypothetical protein